MPQIRKPAKVKQGDPQWYRDAIIYEVHVRAFRDSDGDGIGDFKGLTEKLDYLRELGVTALWVLPFFPSPLKDDGYDTADYMSVHDNYGTLKDFKKFLREAHKRGLRVITELVLNHTSDQHPWFQRARRAKPGSKYRDWYVWSDDTRKYEETRIIFKDFETSNWTWDPVAGAYYWHRFYSHQPDLNFDNPAVKKAMFRVVDFWLGMGVDGLRLDAVPYLIEREGTNCENLPETYDILRELRAHVDDNFQDKMLLAEANQWPEDAVAYFGDGDMCHMAYHFPIMPRLFMALHMEDRFPLLDILEQTPAIPEGAQWALFLRNHDELTLEMVTDEERDYMYRVYARDPRMRVNLGIRRRFAPLMGNNRRTIELLNALLLSMPGTPVLYYGDEIGMGDNIYLGDRNAVRTPMQWSADRNAGFSEANPQQLYLPAIIDPEYHYQTVNVEAQEANPHSLLWWMRRIISIRKRFQAFGRGEIDFVTPENRKILAFVRRFEDETVLVVANLSRYVQFAELDLSEFAGMVPVEVFGRTEFPAIGMIPYTLSMGPHTFYWFTLEAVKSLLEEEADPKAAEPPALTSPGGFETIFEDGPRQELENALPGYLRRCNWFHPRGRRIKAVSVQETLRVSNVEPHAFITMLGVDYVGGSQEIYALPLAYAGPGEADHIMRDSPKAAVARLRLTEPREIGLIYDALADPDFCRAILKTVPQRTGLSGDEGKLMSTRTRAFTKITRRQDVTLHAPSARVERNNTVVTFGDVFALKFFRRLDAGVNPELEIGRYLNERGYQHVPETIGAIEYRRGRQTPVTLAVLQSYANNEGDAWRYTLDVLEGFFEDIQSAHQPAPEEPDGHILNYLGQAPPQPIAEHFGPSLERLELLGHRTAQLHLALSSPQSPEDYEAFEPERFTRLYQRSLYQGLRSHVSRVFPTLKKALGTLPEAVRDHAEWAVSHKRKAQDFYKPLLDERLGGKRIRCHGDLQLGSALLTGKDLTFIDFEGDPSRPLSERRIRRSPLRDAASMLRSLHYAAYAALSSAVDNGFVREDATDNCRNWARAWRFWASASFLGAYLATSVEGDYLPDDDDQVRILLDIFLLDHAVLELDEELRNRPDWAAVPLRAIRKLLTVKNGTTS